MRMKWKLDLWAIDFSTFFLDSAVYELRKECSLRRLLRDRSGTTPIEANNFDESNLWSLRSALRDNVIGKPGADCFWSLPSPPTLRLVVTRDPIICCWQPIKVKDVGSMWGIHESCEMKRPFTHNVCLIWYHIQRNIPNRLMITWKPNYILFAWRTFLV